MSTDNFTGRAEVYVVGRPSYPKSAIEHIIGLAGTGAVVADIGAGTGKFSILMAEHVKMLYGVEPNADMRRQLEMILEPINHCWAVNGTAEVTTLGDKSVDVITIAHALHWFNTHAFKAECRRILKPGGLIVVIYNHIPGRELTDLYRKTVDSFFGEAYSLTTFSNPLEYTREKWLAYLASQDDSPMPSAPDYEAHVATINEMFDRDCINEVLHIDRLTAVYSGQIDHV